MSILKKIILIAVCAFMTLGCVCCGSAKTETNPQKSGSSNTNASSSGGFDYDLSKMGESTAYAQLVDFMNNQPSYLGKTIKIKGDFYIQSADDNSKDYYYIILNDTTACCSAYIECIANGCSLPAKSSNPDTGDIVTITATGIIGSYEEYGQIYYVLEADSIT